MTALFTKEMLEAASKPNPSPVILSGVYEDELGRAEYTVHADGGVTITKVEIFDGARPTCR